MSRNQPTHEFRGQHFNGGCRFSTFDGELTNGDGREIALIRTRSGRVLAALLLAASAIWAGVPTPAQAQAPVAAAECERVDAKESTVVLVCPKAAELVAEEGEGLEALRAAGIQACLAREPCIAWIWNDPMNAPLVAPALSDGLTKDQVQSAIAVWINDAAELMIISAKKKTE